LVNYSPKVVSAYEKLLVAVEADPKLGEHYSGGRPPLSAGGVDPDANEADTRFSSAAGVAAKRSCD
jgi:hypothetical protein